MKTLISRTIVVALCCLFFSVSSCNAPPRQSVPVYDSYVPTPMLLVSCDKMIKHGVFDKQTAVAYHKCIYDIKNVNGRYHSDLERASDLKRIALAEQFAAGKISASQFNSEIADYDLQMRNVEITRQTQEEVADAAKKTAESAERAASEAVAARRAIEQVNSTRDVSSNNFQSQIDQLKEQSRVTRVDQCRRNATSLMGQSACM